MKQLQFARRVNEYKVYNIDYKRMKTPGTF